MFYNHHFIGMQWVWWIVLMLIILLVVFNLLPYRSYNSREDPMDILKKRFARGEIENEEYQERKRIIEDSYNS